ncbi:MAG: segregation/condensation protein A [Planctomycetota bacterium]
MSSDLSASVPRVSIECFEGPLELLLFLIRSQEVDIWDVSLSEVCDQYIAVLERSRDLDIEVGGEFLVIASTLLEIKSYRILPSDRPSEAPQLDPREELLNSVIAYRDTKHRAELLKELELRAAQRFPRGWTENLREVRDTTRKLDGWTLFSAWQNILKATYARTEWVVRVDDRPAQYYRERVLGLLQGRRSASFRELFEGADRMELIASFMAVLELVREGLLNVWQGTTFGEIVLSAAQ